MAMNPQLGSREEERGGGWHHGTGLAGGISSSCDGWGKRRVSRHPSPQRRRRFSGGGEGREADERIRGSIIRPGRLLGLGSDL